MCMDNTYLRVMLLVVALVAEGKALHIVPVASTVETRFRQLPEISTNYYLRRVMLL